MNNTPYSQIARKIPNNVRDKLILNDSDPIQNAVVSSKDPMMISLAKIWFKFIEPNAQPDFNCGKCLSNVLENFRQLKPTLIALKKENDMLNLL